LTTQGVLLVVAVIAVGVFHTLVPDHWLPIAVMARQREWTRRQTVRVAFGAGLGHTFSTLLIGIVVWVAGLVVAVRFGHVISLVSSIALIGFGAWVATASLLELRGGSHEQAPDAKIAKAKKPNSRMALLLILGSSPMIEGIPAFFAAAKFGIALILVMSLFFALSTIATYIIICVYSRAALQHLRLGRLERYGEVMSGACVTIIGVAFVIWPI
jgi:ABC-type nickel/cobalt efflux system permease component RcnA